MARINLTVILGVLLLSVSVLIAFLFGWYQWNRYVAVQQENAQIRRNIAVKEQSARELRSQFKDVTRRIAAPNTLREDPEFYTQLKRLGDASGVRLTTLAPSLSAPLPTIGTQTAAAKTVASAGNSADAKKEEDKKTGYSLANMPLNVRPIVTNITVVGPFVNINTFVRSVYNFRFPAAVSAMERPAPSTSTAFKSMAGILPGSSTQRCC